MSTRKRKAAKRARREGAPGTRGKDLRQEIPTGTVEQVRALIRLTEILDPETDAALPHNALSTCNTVPVYPDHFVQELIDLVTQSRLAESVDGLIDRAKIKSGRPAKVNTTALLVGMFICAIDVGGQLMTDVSKILHQGISPRLQTTLGIRPATGISMREQRRARLANHRRTLRCLHRVLTTMDPSIHKKGRSMPWTELVKHNAAMTIEEQQEKQAVALAFTARLLSLSFRALPEGVLEQYDGSADIDGTPVELFAAMRGAYSDIASSDPDGGVYDRDGDHSETPTSKKTKYAVEFHLIVGTETCSMNRVYMPSLALMFSVDRPGVDPSGAARRALAALAEVGHEPGHLSGDGLYTNATPETFQTPVTKLGWKLVLGYTDAQTGMQDTHDGAQLVDGHWMCPAMTADLVEATRRLRDNEITLDEYRAAIEARNQYRLSIHSRDDDATTRYTCPAGGSDPRAICPLKPASENPRLIHRTPEGEKFDGRPVISPGKHIDPDHLPPVCANKTLTVPNSVGAKYRQPLPYGTEEHTNKYNTLRQAGEGMHGFSNDDAYQALGSPGKRRVRGIAAQTLFGGILLFAANLRKIRQFLEKAEVDAQGRLYMVRPPRKAELGHTGAPPGAAPPDSLLEPAA